MYEVDPLRCPEDGGTMKIICFIEKCQPPVVEKIVRHRELWREVVPRPAFTPGQSVVFYQADVLVGDGLIARLIK